MTEVDISLVHIPKIPFYSTTFVGTCAVNLFILENRRGCSGLHGFRLRSFKREHHVVGESLRESWMRWRPPQRIRLFRVHDGVLRRDTNEGRRKQSFSAEE